MNFSDFMKEVRGMFRDELNPYLEAMGLEPVKVINSLIGIEKKPLTVAIFPTASSGDTVSVQGDMDVARFTVQVYCNHDATEKGLAQGEEYFSAILEFIRSRTFGEESNLDGATIVRMDEMEPVNGGVYLVSARMSTDTDAGWY